MTLLSKYDTFVYDGEGRYLSYDCTFAINTALSGTRSYTYDARGRLTGETFTPLNLDNSYEYDDAGNHITTGQNTFHGETLTAADYDRSNQRVGEEFTYTAEGDPTAYKGDTLTFDAEHHLTSYGTALAATYGPNGTRAWKDVGQDRTTFCYDGETLIGQQTGTNPQDFVPIVHGPDGLIAFGETYYQFDPEGNVVHRLDADGELVNTSVYDAWGVATNLLPTGDPATVTDPFGYKGQVGYYTDHETGLILCTYRYYDPDRGRWLTQDPIGLQGGVNLYGYCGNDPVNGIDPLGLTEAETWNRIVHVDRLRDGWTDAYVESCQQEFANAGGIPIVGIGVNIVNASIYYARGRTNQALWAAGFAALDIAAPVAVGLAGEALGAGVGSWRAARAAKAAKAVAGEVDQAVQARKCFWRRDTAFDGRSVYRRDDLIDPNRVTNGKSNLELMRKGNAPIGPDGKPVVLHHLTQDAKGPIAEIADSFHRRSFRIIHINTGKLPSGIRNYLKTVSSINRRIQSRIQAIWMRAR